MLLRVYINQTRIDYQKVYVYYRRPTIRWESEQHVDRDSYYFEPTYIYKREQQQQQQKKLVHVSAHISCSVKVVN